MGLVARSAILCARRTNPILFRFDVMRENHSVARLAAAIIFCPFMSYHLNLRGLRARSCLSQDELADLLGISRSRISRYEKNEEVPGFSTALGLQVIFDQQPKFTFPRLYDLVEEGVMQRAAELERAIDGQHDYTAARKRHLLEAMMARATSRGEA